MEIWNNPAITKGEPLSDCCLYHRVFLIPPMNPQEDSISSSEDDTILHILQWKIVDDPISLPEDCREDSITPSMDTRQSSISLDIPIWILRCIPSLSDGYSERFQISRWILYNSPYPSLWNTVQHPITPSRILYIPPSLSNGKCTRFHTLPMNSVEDSISLYWNSTLFVISLQWILYKHSMFLPWIL